MTELERKLKNYYENNPDYEQSEGFVERLKALEAGPAAADTPARRRWLLPVAAVIALLIAAGAGRAVLHASRPAGTPAPAVQTEPEGTTLAEPEKTAPPENPAPAEPGTPAAEEKKAPAAAEPETPEEAKPEAPAAVRPEAPAPAPKDPAAPAGTAGTPAGPKDQTPDEQPDQYPEDPDEPEDPGKTDVPEDPDEPDDPADSPDETPPEDPADPEIGAVYQLEDGRETLTLTLMATGESVELDVTGWDGQPEPATEEPPGPATYSGSNPIVNFLFEKNITYHLTRDDDGAVRVDLDVADTGS